MKVYIQKEIYSDSIGILFAEEKNGKRYIAKPVQLEFTEYDIDTSTEPTIRISHFLAPDFLKALAEALDKEQIKTENDFKIQGLLEATKRHLEDMRRLVFKRP